MGNNTSNVTADSHRRSTDLRGMLSVCLACHRNDVFRPGYGEKTDFIKRHIKQFLRRVYKTNDSTIFNWNTWDLDTADITVPDDSVWVEHEGSMVPDGLQALHELFDVIVSVFCPTMILPVRHVAFAYRLLKPNGLFIVMGSGSPAAFVDNITSARARLGFPPLDDACPAAPVTVYYHPGTRTNGVDSFTVFQKPN